MSLTSLIIICITITAPFHIHPFSLHPSPLPFHLALCRIEEALAYKPQQSKRWSAATFNRSHLEARTTEPTRPNCSYVHTTPTSTPYRWDDYTVTVKVKHTPATMQILIYSHVYLYLLAYLMDIWLRHCLVQLDSSWTPVDHRIACRGHFRRLMLHLPPHPPQLMSRAKCKLIERNA